MWKSFSRKRQSFFSKLTLLKSGRNIDSAEIRRHHSISLFFRTQIFIMVMPKIDTACLVFYKTDFYVRNFSEIAGTAENRLNNGFLDLSELYSTFFHDFLHNDAKWQCLQCDGKTIFLRSKFRKLHYSRFLHFCIRTWGTILAKT